MTTIAEWRTRRWRYRISLLSQFLVGVAYESWPRSFAVHLGPVELWAWEERTR